MMSLSYSLNPFFANYQPHGSDLFSMVDIFSYTNTSNDAASTSSDVTSSEVTEKKLAAATVDYYLLGWHPDPSKDLFSAKNKWG